MGVYVAMQRAAGVLIFRGDAWLLMRNARLGHWGFAKGHLEEGESELQGALREVREETGFVPRLDPVFREVVVYDVPPTKKRPDTRKEVVYFLGSVGPRDEVQPSDEHDRVEWLALEDACAKVEFEQLRALLRRADRFRRSRV
jgi:8-oxo-dGTP pyrophosphatase MutT (NUDIX family)